MPTLEYLLGIETSCDDTGAAVIAADGTIRSNVVQSQLAIHADYGGVVPELASRAHIRNLNPVISSALAQAGITPAQLSAIAVTAGPGLIGALLAGVATAKGMALGLGIPLLGIHHLEGHLLSPFLTLPTVNAASPPTPGLEFPFIALLVSGGHTMLVAATALGEYRIVGHTLDDAVGEAFDKGAKLLGLGYPGGPQLAALAQGGNPAARHFPRAMTDRPTLDFSFSGLKTALRTVIIQHSTAPHDDDQAAWRRDVAASYQEALVDVLVTKGSTACLQHSIPRLVVAGGVGANRRLREKMAIQAAKNRITVNFPPVDLCTDNGAMIAYAGWRRWQAGMITPELQAGLRLDARARWPLKEL